MARKNTVDISIVVKDNVTVAFGKMRTASKSVSKSIKGAFKDVGKSIGSAIKSGKGFTEQLRDIGFAAQGAQAILGTFSQAADFAKLGAQAERVERRFAAFAEEAGGASEILSAFQSGVGGAASEMEAMSSASRLLQMGLVSNGSEMEKITEIASRLGDQTMGVTDRVSDFSLLLSNQSLPRLDNFGISSGKVRERIAELQTEFGGMSRETAFMTATLEEAEKSLGKLGPRVDDNLMAFEKAEARLADFRIEMSQKLLPVIAASLDVVSMMSDGTIVMAGAFGTALAAAIKLGGGVGKLNKTLHTTAGRLGVVSAAAFATLEMFQAIDKFNKQLAEGHQKVTDAIGTWNDATMRSIAGGNTLADTMEMLATHTGKAADAIDQAGLVGDVFANKTSMLSSTASEAAGIISIYADSTDDAAAAVKAYNATIDDERGKILLLTEANRKEVDELRKLAKASGFAGQAARRQLKSVVDLEEVLRSLRIETTLAGEMEGFRADMAERGAAAAEEKLKQTEQQNKQTREEALLTSSLNEVVTNQRDLMLEMEGLGADEVSGIENRIAAKNTLRDIEQRNAEALAGTAAAQQLATERAERSARGQEAQRATAQTNTAQLLLMKAAAIEAAEGQVALQGSLKDATDAQVAQSLISQLDPEQLGAAAYTEAVTGIQVTMGLADEKSIALAGSMGTLATAINEGVIPTEKADEALVALIADAEDGQVGITNLIAEFREGPAPINEMALGVDALNSSLVEATGVAPAVGIALEKTAEGSLKSAEAIGRYTTALDALSASPLDPEPLGIEAFAQSADLAYQGSLELIGSIGSLSTAATETIEPIKNADNALTDLVISTDNEVASMRDFAAEIAAMPDPIKNVAIEVESLNESFVETTGIAPEVTDALAKTEDGSSKATAAINKYSGAVEAMNTALADAPGLVTDLQAALAAFRGGDVLPTIPKGTGAGDIPSFQGGGIVSGAIGQPQLAIVHGGEVIFNPAQRNTSTTDQHFNLAIHTSAPQEPIVEDFQMMQSWASRN